VSRPIPSFRAIADDCTPRIASRVIARFSLGVKWPRYLSEIVIFVARALAGCSHSFANCFCGNVKPHGEITNPLTLLAQGNDFFAVRSREFFSMIFDITFVRRADEHYTFVQRRRVNRVQPEVSDGTFDELGNEGLQRKDASVFLHFLQDTVRSERNVCLDSDA
jgi:hypothetical protein